MDQPATWAVELLQAPKVANSTVSEYGNIQRRRLVLCAVCLAQPGVSISSDLLGDDACLLVSQPAVSGQDPVSAATTSALVLWIKQL
jgi:hypothetical protein